MKLLRYLILMFVLILSSCVKSEICSTFYGEVVVTPDHVWDGVEVIMKIVPLDLGNGVSVSSESTINGKNVIRSITYFWMVRRLPHLLMRTQIMRPKVLFKMYYTESM